MVRCKYACDSFGAVALRRSPQLPLNLPDPRAGFLASALPQRVFEAEHFRGWQFEPWQKLSRCPSKFEHGNAVKPGKSLFSVHLIMRATRAFRGPAINATCAHV
jgi:hypothetical protein